MRAEISVIKAVLSDCYCFLFSCDLDEELDFSLWYSPSRAGSWPTTMKLFSMSTFVSIIRSWLAGSFGSSKENNRGPCQSREALFKSLLSRGKGCCN